MFVDVKVLLSAILILIMDVIGAISSNRTLEYAEEFSHIDVLVAVLTFYLKFVDDIYQFLICEVNWCCFKMFFDRLVTDE